MIDSPIGAGHSSFDLIDPESFFEILDLPPETVFLDVGCGEGQYALAAAIRLSPKGRVHAVDAWAEGVETLEETAEAMGLANVRARVADAGKRLPLENQRVDVCLLATVFHDLVQAGRDGRVLKEIRRVLKPLGRLAVVEFTPREGPPGPPQAVRLDPAELSRRLAGLGFRPQGVQELTEHLYLAQFTPEPGP